MFCNLLSKINCTPKLHRFGIKFLATLLLTSVTYLISYVPLLTHEYPKVNFLIPLSAVLFFAYKICVPYCVSQYEGNFLKQQIQEDLEKYIDQRFSKLHLAQTRANLVLENEHNNLRDSNFSSEKFVFVRCFNTNNSDVNEIV